MGGVFGGVFDALMGDIDNPKSSGIFQNAQGIGGEYSAALMRMFQGSDNTQFNLGREALRESVSGYGRAQRQQTGDRALAGGFFDSGVTSQAMSDIDRAELQAFSSGIRDLLIAMEDRKFQFALPFLQGGEGAHQGIEGMKLQRDITDRQQNMDMTAAVMEMVMSMYGGM